jgi:hypothetical protein
VNAALASAVVAPMSAPSSADVVGSMPRYLPLPLDVLSMYQSLGRGGLPRDAGIVLPGGTRLGVSDRAAAYGYTTNRKPARHRYPSADG